MDYLDIKGINERKLKVQKQIDKIKEKAERVQNIKIQPTFKHMTKSTDIVKKYIIKHKRKVFGGMAINEAIRRKSKKDVFYTKETFPDFDFYSPEPITDMVNISNLLVQAGFKNVSAKEAFHPNTYKIKAENYSNEIADISYVWSYIYYKIPTFVINGIHFVSPKYQIMDVYRILTNPMTGWHKIEKQYNRARLLEQFYILPETKQLLKKYKSKILDKRNTFKYVTKLKENIINDIVKNNKDIILVGDYAYNTLIKMSKINSYSKKLIIPDEISLIIKEDNYDKFIDSIIKYMKKCKICTNKKMIKITKFSPFLELYDKSARISINGHYVIRIYSTEICLPYQVFDNIKIGTYHLIMLFLYSRKFRSIISKNNKNNSIYEYMLANLEYARERYFKKKSKIGIERTPFRELQVECMGTEIFTPFHYYVIRKQGVKNRGFEYFPKRGIKTPAEMKKNYFYPNRSGNQEKDEIIINNNNNENDIKK